MTDREMLEFAAKAAGIPPEAIGDGKATIWIDSLKKAISQWSPLTDDGDALRLAVKLGVGISFGQYAPVDVYSVYISEIECGDTLAVGVIANGDEMGVVRRAIVRAAAEIGKGL